MDSVIYPSNRFVSLAPDVLGRTRIVTNYVNQASYYPNGALESIEYANGQTMTMTQNAKRLPENFTTNLQGQAALVDLTYGYDLNNNIDSITDPILGNKTLGYDGVNRLTSASGPWGTGNIAYDNIDNITSKQIGAESLAYAYDPISNRLTGINDGGSQVYNFGYDVYGNVTSNGTNTFVYDDANNLRTSGSNAYQYDAHDRRVMIDKSGDKQYYAYSNSGQLMYRYDTDDQQTTDYIYLAGQLVAKHEEKPDPPAQAAAPTIDPNGGSFMDSVSVSISSTTPSSSIYYTTDGTTPTTSSNLYGSAFVLTANTPIQAITVASGYTDSSVASASFTVTPTPTAAAPAISPNGGSHVGFTDVTLSTSTIGASIYYTIDGSTPTSSSTLYAGIFTLQSSATVKAITVASGYHDSPVSSASFSITLPTAANPTFSVTLLSQTRARVIINSSVPGNTKYYSYANWPSNPPYPNTVYSSPLIFNSVGQNSRTVTVKARVTAPGYNNSGVSSTTFTIPGYGGGGGGGGGNRAAGR